MKTLEQWLSQIEQLHPEAIKLGLERVTHIAQQLNLTVFDCPVITVAGTNGKGSCVKILASILQATGYQVGMYTSPHLLSFNERIIIDNKNIDDEMLCQAFEVIEKARTTTPLTFFEFTTLAALWIFKNTKLDALILEIGLGGRLDAVNIVEPDAAIVTSVDLDHIEWLGKTRETIGYEKAGIFRPQKIAICGDPSPPATLLAHAKQLESEFYCAGKDFSYTINHDTWSWFAKESQFTGLPLPILSIRNVSTVLMTVSTLKSILPVSFSAIVKGIQDADLPGRFQLLTHPYPCILDVAHNSAASKLLAEHIQKLEDSSKLIAVVGMLADKDVLNTLRPLIPLIEEWHVGTLNVARGSTSEQLASHLHDLTDSKCYTYGCVSDAFKTAANALSSETKILVFGSFYTVAEILSMLQEEYE